MSDQSSSGLERFRLLASSMAGRPLSVAPVERPGAPSWTDGATVFNDPDANRRDQICSLSVQASLLASDSLNPEHVAALARRPSIAQRYLAVEGQRALAHNEKSLPPTSRHLIDRQIEHHGRGDVPGVTRLCGSALSPRWRNAPQRTLADFGCPTSTGRPVKPFDFATGITVSRVVPSWPGSEPLPSSRVPDGRRGSNRPRRCRAANRRWVGDGHLKVSPRGGLCNEPWAKLPRPASSF